MTPTDYLSASNNISVNIYNNQFTTYNAKSVIASTSSNITIFNNIFTAIVVHKDPTTTISLWWIGLQ
ncbi:hypothetical protein PROFUN_12679 [Planoprotostelium fungivorum]|uniref:Uncharacterized protein n=1 Tax=Planoprotostelium fungivorum TaxID=1890364 RepID=A0A2P6N6V9_9EUKA|nr:hypothetical protein PROFUN_12679 [Planoprotostelium fungivorum]